MDENSRLSVSTPKDQIAGKRDQLLGEIQEAYGVSKDEAEKQIKQFEDNNKDMLLP